ncbi:PilZ domain-containing protein [Hyalangium gracile]|uniref:PilZ domain-containing protein n=1 Tax=Hyalangium gracile TaxID=394092 RepID=UPI001CCCBD18|nr:PilZ domain-containing protein [Hyalangium gracile]
MAERTDSTGPKNEERRESPRVPMSFQVRRAGSEATFESHPGDLSLGGCAFKGAGLEPGTQLELRFRLPAASDELQVRGEVLAGSDGSATRVRFLDMAVEAELAIARHLDDMELAAPKS